MRSFSDTDINLNLNIPRTVPAISFQGGRLFSLSRSKEDNFTIEKKVETSLPVFCCVFLPPCFLHFASHLRVSLPVHTQPGTERQKEITSLETSPLLSHSSPAMKLHVSGIK